VKSCILSDRLYVPAEYVTSKHLSEFVYSIQQDDSFDYGPFETGVGSIRTFVKKRLSDGQIYYGFARGNIAKVGRLFGTLPWSNQTVAPPLTFDLKFNGKLYTYDTKKIGQQEAADQWLRQKGGLIKAPPRFGKTLTSIWLLSKMRVKTLIITHQWDLLEQYYTSLLDFTNVHDLRVPAKKKKDATGQVVGYFNDYTNPEELDVCLLCWQTFASKAKGDARIDKYKNTWGLVIVDECHPFETPVLIDYDKYMPIGEIYENPNVTHVLSYNLDTKCIEKKRIINRRCHESNLQRMSIYVRGEKGLAVVTPTENHKYYVVGKGYVEAKDLAIGDKLITYAGPFYKTKYCTQKGCTKSFVMDYDYWHTKDENEPLMRAYANVGIDCLILDNKLSIDETRARIEAFINNHHVVVEAITPKKLKHDRRVYNLEVADNHNYFVIANEVSSRGTASRTPTTPILVSNCHRMGGICFSRTVNRLSARYRMGLTGTVERTDGREFLVKDILGPVSAEGKVATVDCHVTSIYVGIKIQFGKNEPLPYLYKRLYNNSDRMKIVLKYAMRDIEAGRFICMAFHSSSIEQLKHWTNKLQMLGVKAEAFYGSCTDREGVLERARSGETQVLVCNRQMLTGIDIPRWDTFYNMFPSANVVFNDMGELSGNYYQEFSRIRTPYTDKITGATKDKGIIRDFVDDSPFCYGSYRKRYKAYVQQQFIITTIKEGVTDVGETKRGLDRG